MVGYKGYGLGLVVEVLGGLLSGEGCASSERSFKSNGVMFTVYEPSFFADEATYEREIEGLVAHVMSSRVKAGINEIFLPGQVEFRTSEKRRREGIDVDDGTWKRICDAARRVGLDPLEWEAQSM